MKRQSQMLVWLRVDSCVGLEFASDTLNRLVPFSLRTVSGGSVLSVMPAEQLSRNDDSHANWCFIPVPVHDVIATQEGMELESEPETPVPMCTSALDVIPSDLLMGTDGAEVASDGIEVAVGHLPSDLPPEVTAEDCFDPYLHPPSGSELPSPHATPSDSPCSACHLGCPKSGRHE